MQTVKIHHSESSRALRAELDDPPRGANWAVANMLARRYFGRRGYAVTCNCESWAEDGSRHNYEAFVGTYNAKMHTTAGRNVHFTIYGVGGVDATP